MLINETRWGLFVTIFCVVTLWGCDAAVPEEGDTIVKCACACRGRCMSMNKDTGACSVRDGDGAGEINICTKSTANFEEACFRGCGIAFKNTDCILNQPVGNRPQECTTEPDGKITLKGPKIEFLMTVEDEANVMWMGNVDTARSRLTIHHDGASASPPISGIVHADGGYCPGQTCPIEIQLLELFANPFTLSGESVSTFRALNHGIWTGVKLADETYYFNDGSLVAVAGQIGGEHASQVGWPDTDVTGAWHDELTTLPGGGTVQDLLHDD